MLIRWEHYFAVYRSFFTVAVLLVCLKRLTRAVPQTQEMAQLGSASPGAVA